MNKENIKIISLQTQLDKMKQQNTLEHIAIRNVLSELSGYNAFKTEQDGYRPEDFNTIKEYNNAFSDAQDKFQVLEYRCQPNSVFDLPKELSDSGFKGFCLFGDGFITDKNYNMLFSWSNSDEYPFYRFPSLDNLPHEIKPELGTDQLSVETAVSIFSNKFKNEPSKFDCLLDLNINHGLDSEAQDMSAAKDVQDVSLPEDFSNIKNTR